MGDIMKRLFIILLSVAVLTLAGCNSTVNEMTEADISYEETKETDESKEPVIAEESNVESSSENETEFQSNKDEAESSEAPVKDETKISLFLKTESIRQYKEKTHLHPQSKGRKRSHRFSHRSQLLLLNRHQSQLRSRNIHRQDTIRVLWYHLPLQSVRQEV